MTNTRANASLTESIDKALDAPWILLDHIGGGDPIVRAQALDNIEDAGRTEDRVRHDYAGRYPLELLQNAHDACADAQRRGAVRFAVSESALIVANEGVPFTPERVRSLVRLGSSPKVPQRGRRETIGYKGIGFTAVFEVTDRPQIISRDVAFELDRLRAQRQVRRVLGITPAQVPARGFPFRLEDAAWKEDSNQIRAFIDNGAVTVIRLPLRKNRTAAELEQRLHETISPEVLLFMPWVNEIEIVLREGSERWTRSTGKRVGAGRLIHLRASDGEARSWLVATTSVRVSREQMEALEDPLWSGVRELGAAVALPWRKGVRADAGTQKLHVYFPTDDELGRALLIHGDFYIDSGRRHIEAQGAGGEVSQSVAVAAAKLVAELSESIADQGQPLLKCLGETNRVAGFGETMGKLLEDALRTARIARPADGSPPRRPSTITRLGMRSMKLERDLVPLLRPTKDLLQPGDDEGPAGELLERLGAEKLSWDEIASRVDLSKADVAYPVALRILARWLDFLDESDRKTVAERLKLQSIVQDKQGRWCRPIAVVIGRPDSPDLPSRLRKTELSVPSGTAIRRLTKALDIPELTVAAALDIVIDAVNNKGFGDRASEARQVHTFMQQTWKHARRELEARSKELGRMSIPARLARGRRTEWRRADRVYFPAQWTGNSLLETLYGRFGQPEFLGETPPDQGPAQRSAAAFYSTLGVASEPRMKRWAGTTHQSSWRRDLVDFDRWESLDEVQAALVCDAGHYRPARRIVFSCLDRLDELLTGDLKTAGALARYLSSTGSPLGTDADVSCTAQSHYGSAHHKRAIGYQRWLIETAAWLPVRNDPSGGDRRPPSEAWTGTRLPSWLMVPQARLRPESARGFRVVNAERPGAESIELALRDLEGHFPELADAPDAVIRSSTWLLKRLDRAHQRSHASSSAPPLPSTIDGQLAWSTTPLIPDLTALDAFPSIEILPAGTWHGLRRGYQLRRASEVVKHELEVGPRIRAARLLSRDQQARLAALLASQGADEDRVATRLARLKEFAVSSLHLSYTFDGQSSSKYLERPFHLDLHRDRANHIIGASLFVRPPTSPAARIALGRDLASYLDVPELHASIALFLTNSDAVIESENLSSEDIAEAKRRVESHVRGKEETDEAEFSVDDLVDPFADALSDDEGVDQVGRDEDSVTPRGADSSRQDAGEEDREASRELPPLDHDSAGAIDVVGQTLAVIMPESRRSRVPGTGGGGSRKVDWTQLERDRRLYGRRGEERVYENERRRLKQGGWDPELVKWISCNDELSPYDIQSVDEDGGFRYIEVKATTSDDPSEPFPISTPELRFAMQHRTNYFIYRVTEVKSARPLIYRYRDPLGDVEAQRGYITMSQALMALPSLGEDAAVAIDNEADLIADD